MKVRGVKEGVQHVMMMIFEGPFAETVGSDGDVNG